MILLFAIAVALAATPLLIERYVAGLPDAPSCPTCRGVTQTTARGWLPDRLLSTAMLTAVRSCTRCGWRGRMRWRWAEDRVRGRSDP